MSRKAKVAALFIGIAVVIGLVAAFAWPVIYRDFIAPPAVDTPSVSEPVGESPEIEGTGDTLAR